MRSWYTPNWPIGIANQLPTQYFSIETTAKQHMPLVLDWHLALQTYPPIVGPCAKMTLLSIASHISQAAVPLPIYFFCAQAQIQCTCWTLGQSVQISGPILWLTFPHGIWCSTRYPWPCFPNPRKLKSWRSRNIWIQNGCASFHIVP